MNLNLIPAEPLGRINDRLEMIEREERVHILFAIESGSRAWGFPSPDSDFDVRMVYVRERDWYLSIFPGRDVIELPLVDDEDINGWDLKKALQLLIKPNPVLMEWLDSPIRYRWNADACAALSALADETLHKKPFLHHYLRLGQSQWRSNIDGKDAVKLEKYFYCLRPALTLRWLRMQDSRPPMNFQHLRDGTDLPVAVNSFLDDLLEKKRVTRELGAGPRIEMLDRLILDEFKKGAEEAAKHVPKQHDLGRKLIKGIPKQAKI
ncbi:nucleotidyltransferase domain-containing protein [Kordiimonas aestuarii]|uniref:nucleotidyltransferase domain-containing protein n=1 Tax=Kordiimonas aestuarii TaxID=1005925 RepID=UPI0021D218AB|nr:nucleotidyltransferase domain-containing protein [Kordiimonas aestuarii]